MTSYSQYIGRSNKALIVFLLDQSYSMNNSLGGSPNRKMDELCAAVNNTLNEMMIMTTGAEGLKDFFDVGLIGYRTDLEANPIIESPLGGNLKGRTLVSLVDVYNDVRLEARMQIYYDEDTGEEIEREVEIPYWLEPKAEGGTPMCSALGKACEIVEEWIGEHPQSFPPIVYHFTDGENQEPGDPLTWSERLRSMATEDGNVLLMNCHLSEAKAKPLMFPHSDEVLPNNYAKMLFRMSSELPEALVMEAADMGFDVSPRARGMAFNADMVSLLRFLDIGGDRIRRSHFVR